MPTLYSSVIRLTNLRPATLTHLGGQHAHAAFLDLVRAVDGELAARLHDANARKPFTVSPLLGLPKITGKPKKMLPGLDTASENARPTRPSSQHGEVYLREGWECWLRVTMLDDALFQSFIAYFMNPSLDTAKEHRLLDQQSPDKQRTLLDQQRRWKLPALRIGDAEFLVSEILTTPGSHPWAGYTSLDALQKRLDEPAPPKFAFQLHTPTAFGWKDNLVATMPAPALVFGSLARAWDSITGQQQARAIENYAVEALLFSTFDLRTERMTLHNQTQLGAVGRFEFIRARKDDEPLARALHLLADLAFYTGLGRKTTQGMGMTSRV